MGPIMNFMTQDHKDCDLEFSKVENKVESGDFEGAKLALADFFDITDKHFKMEEDVIFPAFNESHTQGCNPISVMIMEHNQARSLFPKLEEKIAQKDTNGFFAAADALMILLQQHNMKEENIMYRLCDDALGNSSQNVLSEAIKIKNGK